jgi:hypothetical protein
MGQKIGSDEGLRDVSNHESPREVPAQSQVEAEWQPSVCRNGSAIGRAEVVVNPGPALRDEPARKHAEVRPCVDEEPPLASFVSDE